MEPAQRRVRPKKKKAATVTKRSRPAAKKTQSFGAAFNAAADRGDKVFTWRGKRYTTERAKAAPKGKDAPTPKARPKEGGKPVPTPTPKPGTAAAKKDSAPTEPKKKASGGTTSKSGRSGRNARNRTAEKAPVRRHASKPANVGNPTRTKGKPRHARATPFSKTSGPGSSGNSGGGIISDASKSIGEYFGIGNKKAAKTASPHGKTPKSRKAHAFSETSGPGAKSRKSAAVAKKPTKSGRTVPFSKSSGPGAKPRKAPAKAVDIHAGRPKSSRKTNNPHPPKFKPSAVGIAKRGSPLAKAALAKRAADRKSDENETARRSVKKGGRVVKGVKKGGRVGGPNNRKTRRLRRKKKED